MQPTPHDNKAIAERTVEALGGMAEDKRGEENRLTDWSHTRKGLARPQPRAARY